MKRQAYTPLAQFDFERFYTRRVFRRSAKIYGVTGRFSIELGICIPPHHTVPIGLPIESRRFKGYNLRRLDFTRSNVRHIIHEACNWRLRDRLH